MADTKIDKELAAKREEMKKLEADIIGLRKKKDADFVKFCNDPKIKALAKQGAEAMEALNKKGLTIVDWCIGTNRMEVELEDSNEGSRNWIIFHL